MNGNLFTNNNLGNLEEFCDLIHGIDCPTSAAAETIQEIFERCGYSAPFDDIGTNAAPCRIMYNPETYSWFNVDEALACIKKQFGEE